MSSGSAESRSPWLEAALNETSTQAASAGEPQALDQILAATTQQGPAASAFLSRFLAESKPGKALQIWFGGALPDDQDEVARRLNRDVAAIDALINAQVN